MRAKLAVRTSILALAVALAGPAWGEQKAKTSPCPGEQISVRGKCVDACPTTGTVANPDACECPPGFGMILFGNGGGECKRLACQKGTEIDPKLCDCPAGTEAKPSKKKGKATCVQSKQKATAAAPVSTKAAAPAAAPAK
jgi:hypothetical protein